MKYQAVAGEKSMYGLTWNIKFLLFVLSAVLIGFLLMIVQFEWAIIFNGQRGLGDVLPYLLSGLLFLVVFGFICSVLLSLWRCHLEVSIDGVVSYSFGYRVYTPWNNIVGIVVGPIRSAPHVNQYMYLQFREKALMSRHISDGKQRNMAVIEKSWWLFKNARFVHFDKIILSLPGLTFPSSDWQNSEFASYFRQYAPEAYQRSIESVGEVDEEK